MNDLQQLIETTNRLCNTLQIMALNERQFGYDLCYRIEQITWDIEKSANEMKEITSHLVGGKA